MDPTDAARIEPESPQGARNEATEDLEGIAGKAAQEILLNPSGRKTKRPALDGRAVFCLLFGEADGSDPIAFANPDQVNANRRLMQIDPNFGLPGR